MFLPENQKKIIFLSDFPFSSRDISRFGFNILERNGFSVELWDIAEFHVGDLFKHIRIPNSGEWKKTRYFSSEENIIESIERCEPGTFLISLVDFNIKTLSIYRAISRRKIDFAVFFLNAFPAPLESYLTKIHKLFKKIPKSNPKYAIITMANKILRRYYWLFGVRPATAALISGEKSFEIKNKPISNHTDKVWLHTLDYDNYLKEKSKPVNINQKQWVFLETYYESDPDQFYCPDDKSYTTNEGYFQNIRKLFNAIERKYDVHIVIAEHPKKLIDIDSYDYGGRICYQNRTAEIVNTSAVVLSHDSTAINYAVLFKKPLFFLTSHEIASTDNGKKIQALADLLGRNPIFIDLPDITIPFQKICIDEERYSRYVTDFISKNQEESNSWEIFSRYLKDRFSNCSDLERTVK